MKLIKRRGCHVWNDWLHWRMSRCWCISIYQRSLIRARWITGWKTHSRQWPYEVPLHGAISAGKLCQAAITPDLDFTVRGLIFLLFVNDSERIPCVSARGRFSACPPRMNQVKNRHTQGGKSASYHRRVSRCPVITIEILLWCTGVFSEPTIAKYSKWPT